MKDLEVTTVARAEELLAEWGAVFADRDTRILLAHRSRVPQTRIAALMGIGRTTIAKVIDRAAGK